MSDENWGPTIDGADRWIDKWSADAEAQAERGRELAERVAELSVTASSADRLIIVTVAGSGLVTDIQLADRVTARPASLIAAQILAVMRKAQGELTVRVADAVADTVGADSPSGRAVVNGFARRFPITSDDGDTAGRTWHDQQH